MAKNSSTTTSFPTMGEEIPHSIMNLSGNRSPYTTTVSKKTMGRGSSPTGKYTYRGQSLINEAHGPRCHIVATLYAPNAAEASATQRNTRILPNVIERPDRVGSAVTFWDKRKFGQRA